MGAPIPCQVRRSCLVLLFPLEPPMSPFLFFPPGLSLLVHLRSPHVVFCRPPDPFPFLLPTSTFAFLTTVTPWNTHCHFIGIRPFFPDSPLLVLHPTTITITLFFHSCLWLPAPYPTPTQPNLLSIIRSGPHSFKTQHFPYSFNHSLTTVGICRIAPSTGIGTQRPFQSGCLPGSIGGEGKDTLI